MSELLSDQQLASAISNYGYSIEEGGALRAKLKRARATAALLVLEAAHDVGVPSKEYEAFLLKYLRGRVPESEIRNVAIRELEDRWTLSWKCDLQNNGLTAR